MQLVDHLFIILLFVVQPIHGAWAYRRYLEKIAAGEPEDRVKLYRQTAILEWVALAALAAAWWFYGRPASDLGMVAATETGFWVGCALLVLATVFLIYSWQRAKSATANDRAQQIETLGKLVHFLPQTDREYRTFFGLSITAGIVEEVIYRGFVFWYLAQLMPLWAVVGLSSIVFGLGHSYQGIAGVVRVTLIGLAFGAFYLLTGSIWLPIIAHAVLDILQGAAIVELLRDREDPDAAEMV